jgi:hypothetical protein
MIDSAGVYPENDGISLVDMSLSSSITVGVGDAGLAVPAPGAGGGGGGGVGGGGIGRVVDLGRVNAGVPPIPGYECRTVDPIGKINPGAE